MLVEPPDDNERGKLALGAATGESGLGNFVSYQGRQICRTPPSRRREGLHEGEILETSGNLRTTYTSCLREENGRTGNRTRESVMDKQD